VVPVPLKEPDPDLPLDLGAALDRVYDSASYDLRIDYSEPPPPPPLSTDDAAWLSARIAEARPPGETT
jgi:hypothetical protein